MDLKPPQLSRADLERGNVEVVRRGGWKAGLWIAHDGERSLLVKDLRHSNPIYKWMIGKWSLMHEAAMYGYVRDCPFVPGFAGWIDRDAFATVRISATNLGGFRKPQLTPEFYDRLQECVDAMHAVGVVHWDLRSRRNILVTADGQPMLVDFANALYIGRSWLSRRILVPLAAMIDNSAVLKFRSRDFPETLSQSQRARMRMHKLARVFWPWAMLWRAMGINRGLKKQGAENRATRLNPSSTDAAAHREAATH